MRLHFTQHSELDNLIVVALHLLNHVRTHVRCHHDNRVLEIHGTPLTIGHAPVVEHLQQHIEYVRMRFFDFIEQNHRVRLATHGFGQIAAFFITHIARRRADQSRDRMLFHELGHINADQMIFGIEQKFRQRFAQFSFAYARGSEKQERAIRPLRVTQPCTRATYRIRHQPHGFVLPDHARVQPVFHLEQLFALALHHARDWYSGCARHHFGDFFGADLRA